MTPIKRSLGGFCISLVELVIGILLLVDPIGFTSGIITAAGVILLAAGLGSVIRYFRTDPVKASTGQLLVKGLLLLMAGGFCAFNARWFLLTFPAITWIYGLMTLAGGLIKLQWTVDMIRMKRSRWFFTAISAAASVLCGAVIMLHPFDSAAVLWMFIGISLIAEAVLDVIGGIFGDRDKRAKETAPTAE